MAESKPENMDTIVGRALGVKPRTIKSVRFQLMNAGLHPATPAGLRPVMSPAGAAAHVIATATPGANFNKAANTAWFVGGFRDADENHLFDALAGVFHEMTTRSVDCEVEFLLAGAEDLAVRIEWGAYSEKRSTSTFTIDAQPFEPAADTIRSTAVGSRALQTIAGLIDAPNERDPEAATSGSRDEPGRSREGTVGSHRTYGTNAHRVIPQGNDAHERPSDPPEAEPCLVRTG